MTKKATKRPKIENLLNVVRQCIDTGKYLDTIHASKRKTQRQITLLEICQVLTKGRHEKSKDWWEEKYAAWNYAVRGKTVDGRELRVIVSFDEKLMLLITAFEPT